MKPNWQAILDRALTEGAQAGVRRAFKHTDQPGHDIIAERVVQAIWEALDEVLVFEEGE